MDPSFSGGFSYTIEVAGNPAVVYYDYATTSVKYIRATNSIGTTWGTPITLGNNASSVRMSMVIANGNPAVAFSGNGANSLVYIRAIDTTGAIWGVPVILPVTCLDSSMTIVNGNPAISYYSNISNELGYIRATDITGTTWGAPIIVDTPFVGTFSTMIVVASNPAIAYYNIGNGDLVYIRATNNDGSVWGTRVTLDGTGNVGQSTSMIIVGGNPAVAYYDVTNANLKYIRANDTTGASWGTPLTIDNSTGNVGVYPSLAIVTGQPAISYLDATNNTLKYIKAFNGAGSLWATPITLDTNGGSFTSMLTTANGTFISYQGANTLKYATVPTTAIINYIAI